MHVFTPEPMPLAVAGPDAAARLTRDMERQGIQVHTGAGVTEVATDGRQAAFSDGQSLDADFVITIPTHSAPELVEEAGLLGPSGWVHVTPETLEAAYPRPACSPRQKERPLATISPPQSWARSPGSSRA
jgi:sulfide:quinone oxidoreductase